jgi:hypothetical protein
VELNKTQTYGEEIRKRKAIVEGVFALARTGLAGLDANYVVYGRLIVKDFCTRWSYMQIDVKGKNGKPLLMRPRCDADTPEATASSRSVSGTMTLRCLSILPESFLLPEATLASPW